MNTTAKLLLIIFSGLISCLVFQTWTTAPYIGEVEGINNGAGIVTLICSGIIIVLSLMNAISTKKFIACSILSVVIICSCIFYIQTLNEAKQLMVNASKITMFGISTGQNAIEEDTPIFTPQPVIYFICCLSVINILICLGYKHFPPEAPTVKEVQEAVENVS